MDIECGLGKDSTGTYALTVTVPGGEETRWDSLPLGEGFKRLRWLGFISLAEGEAVFYIDNVMLRRLGE